MLSKFFNSALEILVKLSIILKWMPENSIQSALRETFSLANKEAWKQFASQELDGKNPDEALAWNSEDNIRFSAYYDASDEEQSIGTRQFQLTVAADPYFGPAKWLNVPSVTVTSEDVANRSALQHLTNGADGVVFNIPENVSLHHLLKSVEWRFCSLFFAPQNHRTFLEHLKKFANDQSVGLDEVSGGIFWDVPISLKIAETDFNTGLKNIVKIQQSTPVSEIANSLSLGVALFGHTKDHSKNSFERIGFSIPAGTSFLETIAKLKALRYLWFQIAQAYSFQSFDPGNLFIHVRSEPWIDAAFQPHGNMLKSTIACMASVIGGADAITIHAEDENNAMMTRVARNVSNLLREESYFDKVSDPSAGAYAIEAMTSEFAQQAWKLFQQDQKK